jgi:hypothetical protein
MAAADAPVRLPALRLARLATTTTWRVTHWSGRLTYW